MSSAKRLQQEAYRAWFVGIMFNAVAGAYTLWQLRQREQTINKNDGEGVVESKKILKYECPCRRLCPLLTGFTENGILPISNSSLTSVISLFRVLPLVMRILMTA